MLQKCYQRQLILLAFVVLVLENELQYHGLAVRINRRDDGATLFKNLVNFWLVTPMVTGLICVPMYLYLAKIDLTSAFVMLPFRNATEYCYTDGCINSSNDQAISHINLVGFWSVSPDFMRINCVSSRRQSALGLVYLPSASFAEWQHSYLLLLLAGGDTVAQSGLYARLCHAFLVLFISFLARDVIYTSRAYAMMPVRLFVCMWRKCIGAL